MSFKIIPVLILINNPLKNILSIRVDDSIVTHLVCWLF